MIIKRNDEREDDLTNEKLFESLQESL
jgi:hypothetical protein